ncbi:MAG: hypothetical protein QOG68_2380 [Solirubrobacteraceae bacterium]|jgi:hypothetical protein|nr:hypothetical protein [Solirubrobacteraceae bacterium]
MGLQSVRSRGHGVARGWPRRSAARPATRTARAVEAAQRNVEAAAARYQQLRAAASGPRSHIGLRTWQQLLLLTFGGGVVVGVLCLWLLATMYLGYSALLAVPVIAGPAALLVVRLRRTEPVRRPVVEDLVRAMRELREAEAAARRAHARNEPADVTHRDPAIG